MKIKEILFTGINAVMLVPILLTRPSLVGFLVFLLFQLLLWLVVIKTSDGTKITSRHLPFMVFSDIGVCIGIHWDLLYASQEGYQVKQLPPSWCVLFAICIVLLVGALFGGYKRRWLFWMGLEFCGILMLLLFFGNGKLFEYAFSLAGSMFLIFFVAVSFVWIAICEVAVSAASKMQKQIYGLSVLLMIIFYLFCKVERKMIQIYMKSLPEHFDQFVTERLSWVWVLVILVLTIGGAFMIEDKKYKRYGYDALVLLGIGGFVFLMKISTVSYFAYNWLFFFLYAGWFFYILHAEKIGINNEKRKIGYLHMMVTVGLAICMILISRGLGANAAAIFCGAYLLCFVVKDRKSVWYWLVILAILFTEAAAWVIKMRYIKENLTALFVIAAFGALALWFLSWEHPAKLPSGQSMKYLICAASAILMLIPALRLGTEIRIEASDQASDQIAVTIAAHGTNNSMEEAYFYWSDDGTEQTPKKKQTLKSGTQTIPIKKERLIICVTDQNGIQTKRTYWYPYSFKHLNKFNWGSKYEQKESK